MKRMLFYCLLTAVSFAVFTTSCKEKKQNEDIIVKKYVAEQPKDPIRLPDDVRTTDVEWLGKRYVVKMSRVSVDSLPKLADETGQKYFDNRVNMVITRNDASEFIKKTFTKNSFVSYIDESFRKKGMLENIIFHGVEDNQLKFGVVISLPGSDDEFIPLDLSIDNHGGIAIKSGKLFDEIPTVN